MPRSPADAEEIAEQLRHVVSVLVRRARSVSGGDVLAYPLLSILKRLDHEGAVTTADLARAEMIAPQTAGGVVAKLEEEGLVARKDDAQDGRRRTVHLTASGRKAIAEARARSTTWLAQQIIDRLDPSEIRVLTAAMPILRKLVES